MYFIEEPSVRHISHVYFRKIPSGKAKCLIVLHAGTRSEGLIDGCDLVFLAKSIKVITKLPNSEQSYKGKVKTHNYINRQNQSTTGKL